VSATEMTAERTEPDRSGTRTDGIRPRSTRRRDPEVSSRRSSRIRVQAFQQGEGIITICHDLAAWVDSIRRTRETACDEAAP